MFKTQTSYLQHRHAIGTHSHWKDQPQQTQKQYNTLIKKLASRPGLHSDNVQQQSFAYTLTQFIALLTSIHNSDARPLASQHNCAQYRQPKNSNMTVIQVKNSLHKTKLCHNTIAIPLWDPITHSIEHTDRFLVKRADFSQSVVLELPPCLPNKRINAIPSEVINNKLFKKITGVDISKKMINAQSFTPTFFFFEQNEGNQRCKRISEMKSKELEMAEDQKYIRNNCHIRTKTNNGTVIGDTLLVGAEVMRNPFRAVSEEIYKSINNNEPMEEPWRINLLEGLNTGTDIILGIFTLGAYPIIKYSSVLALKSAGHAINKDTVCLKNEFTPEAIGQLLFDTEVGLTHRKASTTSFFGIKPKQSIPSKPTELKNIQQFKPDGTFVQENINSKLNTVKYMKVIHEDKEFYIQEKEPGKYYLIDPKDEHSAKIQVYFDAKTNKIHLDNQIPKNQGLDYDIIDGKHFIEIHGQQLELRYNWDTRNSEVVVKKSNGELFFVPVYNKPLSKTWHLSIENERQIFNSFHNEILNKISVDKNERYIYVAPFSRNKNNNDAGKIYYAKGKNSNSKYSPNNRYIEMNSKLVPVRESIITTNSVRYKVYNKQRPALSGYPVEWDGNRWVFELSPLGQGLDFDYIIDGKPFIEIKGISYELLYNRNMHVPEVAFREPNGKKITIPVYMEPISKTWHLSKYKRYPIFNRDQVNLLNKINIEKNNQYFYVAKMAQNKHQDSIGNIYLEKKPGHIFDHKTSKRYIEMNGKLVPVRKNRRAKEFRYEIYDDKQPDNPGYLIRWDGFRWVFEIAVSSRISRKLKQLLVPNMYEKNINSKQLSFPDKYGIQWNQYDEAFLQIGNEYIKIKPINRNRFLIEATCANRKIILYFRKNKFFVETVQQRIQNLLRNSSNRRKLFDPIKVLQIQNNFNEKKIHDLFAQYEFPKEGIFNKLSFAIEMEQTGSFPIWADRFKKNQLPEITKTEILETITIPELANPDQIRILNLGKHLGSGNFGQIFLDADDINYVIKRYRPRNDDFSISAQVTEEAQNFQYYYGKQSTQIFHDSANIHYLRMYKIPGIPLDKLSKNSLPKDAVERYIDMLEKLNRVGIIHGDLHPNNIMWDADSKTFFPLDINNIKRTYFNSNPNNKKHFNIINERQWNAVIMKIKEKMVK